MATGCSVNKHRKLLLSFVSLCVALLLLVVADALIGPHAGFIYPPGVVITHRTPEYVFTAHINTLGFRSDSTDFSPQTGKTRLMVLGDSYTYGWGVNYDSTWPKILADELDKRNVPVEVFNLGWVGWGPTEYADIAETAIPILKPQLIVVAVLQAEDLFQVQAPRITIRSPSRFLRWMLPNLWRFGLGIWSTTTSPDLQGTWQRQARRCTADLSQGELSRFEALDEEIKRLFQEGLLNPYLINLAIKVPDYFLRFTRLADSWTTDGIDRLSLELARIKAAGFAINAEVIVVAVPYGAYVHRRYLNSNRRLGFRMDSTMLSSTAPENAIGIAARRAGLEFIPVLADFRQYSDWRDHEALYYELDQHFTLEGNRLFASALLATLEGRCRSLINVARGTAPE